MTDPHLPPELDELGLTAEQRAELDALPAEERQPALEYLDQVSLFGSRSREFFSELAPQLADLGHQLAALVGEQRSDCAREAVLDRAMQFSLRGEAAHAIARRDIDTAVQLNSLADRYRDKNTRSDAWGAASPHPLQGGPVQRDDR